MTNKITHGQIKAAFNALADAMGWDTACFKDGEPNTGAVGIEFYAYGGGWRMFRIAGPTGGETNFGPGGGRMSSPDFLAMLKGMAWMAGYCSVAQRPIIVAPGKQKDTFSAFMDGNWQSGAQA